MLRQIFDDDARLWDGARLCLVAQYREFADRPDFLERCARGLIHEIDDVRLERRVVLVEGDQHFLAERRKRMEAERKRHAAGFPLRANKNLEAAKDHALGVERYRLRF